jgi:hypothetical protein
MPWLLWLIGGAAWSLGSDFVSDYREAAQKEKKRRAQNLAKWQKKKERQAQLERAREREDRQRKREEERTQEKKEGSGWKSARQNTKCPIGPLESR